MTKYNELFMNLKFCINFHADKSDFYVLQHFFIDFETDSNNNLDSATEPVLS